MSVYYTIKEHLRVDNTERHPVEAAILHTQLSLLGAAMLRGDAYIDQAVIVADGEMMAFDGKIVNEAFHKAMDAIDGAQRLDVNLCYGYTHRAWSEAIEPGPFIMTEHLAGKNPQELDGLFYSMYNYADCAEDGKGIIAAYGRCGSTFYSDVVPSRKVATLPKGIWYAPMTAVVYDPEDEDAALVDMDAVEEVCRQLCQFSSDDDLSRDEHGVSFYLNNPVLHGDEELQAFASLCGKLMTLTNDQCFVMADLADLGDVDPKTASVEISADGSYTIELVTV